jgi:hypothetical protein
LQEKSQRQGGNCGVRKRLLIVGVSAVGLIAFAVGGAAMAQSSGGGVADDRDEQVSGAAADRAGAAVLESLGDGRVTGVERDSDNAYEVEVRRADGSTVDVDLNESFQVVKDGDGNENDRDDANDADDRDDGVNDRDDGSDDGPNDRDDDSDDGPNDD